MWNLTTVFLLKNSSKYIVKNMSHKNLFLPIKTLNYNLACKAFLEIIKITDFMDFENNF